MKGRMQEQIALVTAAGIADAGPLHLAALMGLG